jgi:flagellar biosynthetic protein FliQ
VNSDQTVNVMRHLLLESLIIASPLLFSAGIVSLLVSLMQTLTGIQEQTLTTVPRLLVVFVVLFAIAPWIITHSISFTMHLWMGMAQHLG